MHGSGRSFVSKVDPDGHLGTEGFFLSMKQAAGGVYEGSSCGIFHEG